MTKQVQRRRGTATQHTSFTGAEGELSVNTTNKSVHVHDNVTAGGFEAARADMDNVTSSSILTAAGITATTTELNYVDGVTSAIQTQIDSKANIASPTFTGTLTTANLTATGTTTLAGASTSADITFGDNDKAVFGAGSDLQIYHDGAASYVQDTGTGNLQLRGDNSVALRSYSTTDNYLIGNFNGSVDIYYDNAIKLATTSTGIDVTGTVTADGLTVDGDVSLSEASPTISFTDTTDSSQHLVQSINSTFNIQGQSVVRLSTAATKRFDIDNGGDISFYEDTGTTPKFFWDASAESLGIGTTSFAGETLRMERSGDMILGLFSGASNSTFLNMGTTSNRDAGQIGYTQSSNHMFFRVNDAERMRIDSSGNVGIGTTSPSETVHINSGTANTGLFIESTDANSNLIFRDSGSTANIALGCVGDDFRIQNNNSESMRIDSSGSLLHGTTSSSIYNDTSGNGVNIKGQQGQIIVAKESTSASDPAMILNNTGVDSSIIQFSKDGSTVGSIGASGGDMFAGTGDTGLRFVDADDAIVPWNTSTNAGRDNAVDLGKTSERFDDIYATNGTIQTSDRNEKQDIAELSDTEQRVAVAAKGLLRKFRWRDAVEAKGDEARTHFGVIAQDLQAAFAAEGLDAGDYAMFISSTWTDEETGEERTRMGVRYSELLAFIIAAI